MSSKNFMSYEDAATVLGEYADKVNELKSGLTNYETQNNINLDVPNRKNVLPLDVSRMKVSNHVGTWSGNSYTVSGITFTLNINDGQIVSVVATGTAEAVAVLNAYYNTETDPTEISFDSDFILNGCPSGGGTDTYLLRLWNVGGAVITDTGNGSTLTKGTKINAFDIRIASGYECPIGGITFYPMLRPSYITDATFAPYIPSVESRIEAVEEFLPTALNVTLDQNVEGAIDDAKVFRFGKLIVGNIRVTLNNTVSGGSPIIHGLPKINTSLAAFNSLCPVTTNKTDVACTVFNEQSYGATLGVATGTTAGTGVLMLSFLYVSV